MIDEKGDGPGAPPQGGGHADEQEEEENVLHRADALGGHVQQGRRGVPPEKAVGKKEQIAPQEGPQNVEPQHHAGEEKGAEAPQKHPLHVHPSLLFSP